MPPRGLSAARPLAGQGHGTGTAHRSTRLDYMISSFSATPRYTLAVDAPRPAPNDRHEEDELQPEATVKRYLTVRQEGKTQAKRWISAEGGRVGDTVLPASVAVARSPADRPSSALAGSPLTCEKGTLFLSGGPGHPLSPWGAWRWPAPRSWWLLEAHRGGWIDQGREKTVSPTLPRSWVPV